MDSCSREKLRMMAGFKKERKAKIGKKERKKETNKET